MTSDQRSRLMSKVKQKDTKPEKAVRSILHGLGYRFRLHRRDLPGSPDIVLPKYRLAVFVHGCFWHSHPGCKKASMPKTNTEFWRQKLEANKKRDLAAIDSLNALGWRVLVVWECETRDAGTLRSRLSDYLSGCTLAKPEATRESV